MQSPAAVQLPDNPLRGRALYESKECLRCHGLAGSSPSIGPILGAGSFDGTFLELGADPYEAASRGEADAVIRSVSNDSMNPLFASTVHATEEAIINALVAGRDMVGDQGHFARGIDHDTLRKIWSEQSPEENK